MGKAISQKNKKRIRKHAIFFGMLSVGSIVGASVVACGSGVQWKSSIQLIVSDNNSTLADQSFSESTYNGIRDFYINDLKIPASDVPEANSPDVNENNGIWKRPGNGDEARIQSYINAKNDGSDIIVATGFNQNNALQQISQPNSQHHAELANTGFVFVDGTINTSGGSNPTNIASVSFRADQGSFLAGIATAVYLNLNQDYFHHVQKAGKDTLAVSGFVGLSLPSTTSYLNGWRLGLLYWNNVLLPHLTLDGTNSVLPISWAETNGDKLSIADYASASFNANEAKATTLTDAMIKAGASFIFPIAGPQTQLVVNKISQDGARTAVLGVDTAQENVSNLQVPLRDNSSNPEFIRNTIPFSSLKALDYATENIINAIHTGKVSNGYQGFGWNNIGDLSNNGVGVSDPGLSYLIDPFLGVSGADNKVDLSSVSKASLKDLYNQRKANPKDAKVLENYANLLTNGTTITDTNNSDTNFSQNWSKWVIDGNEMTNKFDAFLPAFTASNNPDGTSDNVTYSIDAAFGGVQSKNVATGTLLDGTKWQLTISKA